VIHDIGYRHYIGQRLGRAAIVRELYVQSLRSAYGLGRTAKSKILPFLMLGGMVLPAFILDAVLVFAGLPEPPLEYARYVFVLQAVVSIFVAGQAPQLFSRDLRFRSITLYFARPVTALDYVVAKTAALATALLLLMIAPLVVLYAGGLLAELAFWGQTRDFAVAVAGALVLALVLAGLGGLISSTTTRRGFGVAAVITVLLVSLGGAVIIGEILQTEAGNDVAGYAGLLSPTTMVDGLQSLVFGVPSSTNVPPPDGALGTVVFALATAASIAGSFGLLVRRYRRRALT
jgi:ABC-2 type transport system permease protein